MCIFMYHHMCMYVYAYLHVHVHEVNEHFGHVIALSIAMR